MNEIRQHEDLPISIPAPARGRTFSAESTPNRCYFNSRPREGANEERELFLSVAQFQFPPPRGGEHDFKRNFFTEWNISIPAPARGRTSEIALYLFVGQFQFPPPRGGERFWPM